MYGLSVEVEAGAEEVVVPETVVVWLVVVPVVVVAWVVEVEVVVVVVEVVEGACIYRGYLSVAAN